MFIGCFTSFNSRSRVGSDEIERNLLSQRVVSIHAPAWGATFLRRLRRLSTLFQFTLPRGERLKAIPGNIRSTFVSIHAPAWGATVVLYSLFTSFPRFNSRSRVGSDTTAAGGVSFWRSFNSRSRVGSDVACPVSPPVTLTFQFTLPRGERLNTTPAMPLVVSFNSRSRVGSDSCPL